MKEVAKAKARGTRLKAMRVVEATHDLKDIAGWRILKGTILHVMKEGPKHPRTGVVLLVVRVDNGTGHLDLMPETVVDDIGLKPAKAP